MTVIGTQNGYISENQLAILTELLTRPGTSNGISLRMNWTYNKVSKMLRRLEDRNFVRRIDLEQKNNELSWELTAIGRQTAKRQRW